MIGSVTLGSLAIFTLATVADVSERGILSERTRDTYLRLVAVVSDWLDINDIYDYRSLIASDKFDYLSQTIERLSSVDKKTIKKLTIMLIDCLKYDALCGGVGVNIKKLNAASLQLAEIAP